METDDKKDLQKKLIVQSKKLDDQDIDGYTDAQVLKEENITLRQIQGDDYESSADEEISDTDLNEFWHKEAHELEAERKELRDKKHYTPGEGNNTKLSVDKKLEEFLSVHSANLTTSVREFIQK